MNAQEPLPNRLIKQQQEVDSCLYIITYLLTYILCTFLRLVRSVFETNTHCCFSMEYLEPGDINMNELLDYLDEVYLRSEKS